MHADEKAPAIFWLSVAITHLIFAGAASAQTNERAGMAVIRSVHGDVEYYLGQQWLKLRNNQELNSGASLRTSSNAECYLQVNGFTSTVKLGEATTVVLQKITQEGVFIRGDSQTILDL